MHQSIINNTEIIHRQMLLFKINCIIDKIIIRLDSFEFDSNN